MGLFKRDEPKPEESKPDAAAAAAAAPDPVTRADFAALDARLGKLAELMEQGLSRPVVVSAPAAAMPEEPEVSDAELDAAIAEGKEAAPRIKQLIDKRLGRARREIASELDTFRNYGTTMLSTLAERVATSSMDPELLKRFDNEIKQLVNQCDVALRGHPETWQTAYDTIVGRHHKELEAERIEADRRRRAEEEAAARNAPQPGKGGRPAATAEEATVPTIQELAGDFPYLGEMSEEEFIRRINRGLPRSRRYKDWNDYIGRGHAIDKALQEMREGDEWHEGIGTPSQ